MPRHALAAAARLRGAQSLKARRTASAKGVSVRPSSVCASEESIEMSAGEATGRDTLAEGTRRTLAREWPRSAATASPMSARDSLREQQ